ncbi:DegV family protein [Paenibacillus aceris]|uniref:DegV family protein with EDD domain n=1 Tax=Paenibacillus aceris TaxID=869555 RepID=A0ABS4HUJ4_9BACL|nr:DegV family protein [Paenibacillus aceris]MBP1961704.1 DegV family protein with EDD domain [Paenibacillus aceris]NHW34437.1 DegV family protein [Paenibacillus aceris]
MSRVRIFTDSTCDLSEDLIQQYQIEIVPLYVVFEEQSLKDGVSIKPSRLFELVDQTGKLPKTAAPSPLDFERAFEGAIQSGDDVVYIGLSSELSSTIQNASIAAANFPDDRITVIDSMSLSTGIGVLVLKAAHAAHDGKSVAEIKSMIESLRSRIEVEFIIDTLEYLHKGGRCSSVQHFIGSLLKIRPVVKVINGAMTLKDKVRGKREKALQQLLDNTLAQKDDMDTEFLFVTHALAAEEAAYVKRQIEQQTNVKQVYITETGCVVSSHCGPRTVGIVFAKK